MYMRKETEYLHRNLYLMFVLTLILTAKNWKASQTGDKLIK